jgi:ABC-type polysaccharide/polyol phosphate export permease
VEHFLALLFYFLMNDGTVPLTAKRMKFMAFGLFTWQFWAESTDRSRYIRSLESSKHDFTVDLHRLTQVR